MEVVSHRLLTSLTENGFGISLLTKNFIEDKLPLIKEEYKLDDDLVKEKLYDTLMQDVDKYIERAQVLVEKK